MIYKVGILGATGRMGQEIASLLTDGFTCGRDALEFSDAVAQSKKLSSIEGVPVRTSNEPPFEPVHVWIDFSSPAATVELLGKIQEPIVIGTTGFTSDQKQAIENYAKTKAVLLSANTSPGMNLVFALLQSLRVDPSLGFDVVLSETHHNKKKDSPSGTAKTILEILKNRGQDKIQIEVARAGGVKGVHKVSFISEEEEFSIEHRVFDRKVFARGALLAAHFLLGKKPGLYSMADVFTRLP